MGKRCESRGNTTHKLASLIPDPSSPSLIPHPPTLQACRLPSSTACGTITPGRVAARQAETQSVAPGVTRFLRGCHDALDDRGNPVHPLDSWILRGACRRRPDSPPARHRGHLRHLSSDHRQAGRLGGLSSDAECCSHFDNLEVGAALLVWTADSIWLPHTQ